MRRLQAGEKIGDYVIRGFLGAGGMGEVYQGVHTRINRLAAIKVLSHYGNNPTFISRFLNEARVQSCLHHPNIATLYDFKEIGGQFYIFMEFADGDLLEDLIKSRFFAVEDALKAFESICEAVAFIHRHGIIHRDIKAQNIKLTPDGNVKLLDFGIAKDAASQRLTKVGGVIGTPSYLAPEQLVGYEATAQTDIWSLGVLFYGMLTGAEPFRADTFGELHSQISAASFELPEKSNPAITREISQIVARCLKKEPAQRYQSVNEIGADIRKIRRGERARKSLFGAKKRAKSNTSDGFFGESPILSVLTPVSNPMLPAAILSAFAVVIIFGLIGFVIWAGSSEGGGNSNVLIVKPIADTPQINIPGSIPSGSKNGSTRVLIETNEGSAEIFRNDELIGKTPFEVEGSEGETVDLTLRREGFMEKQVRIDLTSRRRVYTFSLQRK